jgi:hypothetical protein
MRAARRECLLLSLASPAEVRYRWGVEQPKKPRGDMTTREAGLKGGQETLHRYGYEHYQRIGKMGGTVAQANRRKKDAGA